MISKDEFLSKRKAMVDEQLRRKIQDPRVLQAMMEVPRHLFVEENLIHRAYENVPLPIAERQTISQPYMVAYMTQALRLKGGEKVLEIGTGSGYQTAVLSRLADRVLSMERLPRLGRLAEKRLAEHGCRNVLVRIADGTYGWSEEAPFDAILVTAGAPRLPKTLAKQLKEGGRLVLPIGSRAVQDLYRYTKTHHDLKEENLGACRFVKLVGRHGWEENS